MLGPVRWLVWALVRILLALRYRVTMRGQAEALRHPGPYLILPNHPAYIDPPNILVRLWPAFRMRPMLLETNFESPILAPFAWLLRAIRVPDTERASAEARARAEAAVQAAIDALKAGDNVIVWPSGRLWRDGVERVGGARTVADVLAAVPNATVALVRTRGLWGSMFSWARGKPSLGGGLVRGIGLLLANLIAFAPRRRVTITLEAFGPNERPEPTREKVNRWLEAWYNGDVPREEPTYIPYHFLFGPRTYTFPPPPAESAIDASRVKPETKRAVAEILEEKLKRPLADAENTPDTTFLGLGLDSLDAMEVTLRVEQHFGFTGDTVPTTVGQLWALAQGLLETAPPKPPPAGWFAPPDDNSPPDIPGDTIPAAVVTQAFRHPRQVIAADDLAGAVTYEKLLVGAGAMAKRFRDIEAPNVGLLLPASVGADLAFLGIHLAGKLPVVLNWTTGPGNLAHAARLAGLTHVVTSKAFIDRTQVEVPGPKFLFLEDVRGTIGKIELLRRLLAVRWFARSTKARLLKRAATDRHAPAVLLFTSGSEKAPKAVPLTHENILAIERGAVAEFHVLRTDSVLGFLPMFHSFGLVITTVLPLAAGVRVVHHPDPTDAGALVRKAAGYRPTLVAGTPTFLGHILDRAKPGDLDSLRLIVSGAEAAPPALFEKVKKLAPKADVVEGYGITETAAVVSVHRPGQFKSGTLGEPLPGVEIRVADLETNELLPPGKMGMLLVSGPNVFPGYLGPDAPSPFRDIDGKRWYVTGDLGELDPSGQIIFRGRLKRFLKAGGEMISLPALEEPFAKQHPPTEDGPRVAVEGMETPDGRRIVLFTTVDISLKDANARLQAEGFRGVMRLDEVRKVDKIPVLGTGKTDYKALRAMIEQKN
jgi:acyl-CoA synthetase (AMP-forming)/AMP-acid ligase II/1-acyl-sn-glycerol-3-phosphate acyltransferase/acyl carrier protein